MDLIGPGVKDCTAVVKTNVIKKYEEDMNVEDNSKWLRVVFGFELLIMVII